MKPLYLIFLGFAVTFFGLSIIMSGGNARAANKSNVDVVEFDAPSSGYAYTVTTPTITCLVIATNMGVSTSCVHR